MLSVIRQIHQLLIICVTQYNYQLFLVYTQRPLVFLQVIIGITQISDE